jgi:ParB-like chromosome segregation protein Spo0J
MLQRPKAGERTKLKLKVREIETRPDLFQPRGFFMGIYELDNDYVSRLGRLIGAVGELRPLLVIKLGEAWVVVNGHHRLAAYRKLKWEEIACEWFSGSVQEAVDESIHLNSELQLELTQPDRLEAAWKRVVLGWGGSKAELSQLCGVSPSSIANMRRMVNVYNDPGVDGKLFRERLAQDQRVTPDQVRLDAMSWSQARIAFNNLEKKTVDQAAAAAKLARRLRSSLQDFLSRDYEVTAKALTLYDFDLMKYLKNYLRYAPLKKPSDAAKEGLPDDEPEAPEEAA